jgi:HSP20 family protein
LPNGKVNAETLVPPFTDIYISNEGYQLFLDMPGISKKNFKVKVDNDELIVTGKKTDAERNHKYLNNEIFYSGFHRHFVLPNDVDSDKIDASYKDGVLKLFIHKREEFKPKLIEIK